MKFRKIYIFLIPLAISLLLFVLIYIFLTVRKENEGSRECVKVSEIEVDFREELDIFCIKTYSKVDQSLYIEIYNEENTYERVRGIVLDSSWASGKVEEVDGDISFTVNQSVLKIIELSDMVYITIREVDESKPDESSVVPEPVPVPTPVIPSTPSFVVTSTEISRINTTQKVVVFTFDGGAGIQSLDKILAVLDKYDVKGTFFVTGKWAETQKESLEKISKANHEVFNHTYSHPNLTQLTDSAIIEELSKGESAISKVTGKTTKPFYRPPYGARDKRVREIAASQGYQTIYWSIDALDWKESTGTTEQEVKDRVLNNLNPGYIYLMHIGDNITGNVLDELFSTIQSRGYSIKSLSEMLIK